MEEVAILSKIDHPNIVNYYETYDDQYFIYLVMEYIQGDTLTKSITKNKNFGEKAIAKYIKQLFLALNHCHAQGIVHRDVKPDNIMINEKDEVRLIDFGLALATNGKRINELVGSPYFLAPEAIDLDYGPKADIWACGVMLYQLMSGKYPFYETKNINALYQRIKVGRIDFDHPAFKKVSGKCKDLI